MKAYLGYGMVLPAGNGLGKRVVADYDSSDDEEKE